MNLGHGLTKADDHQSIQRLLAETLQEVQISRPRAVTAFTAAQVANLKQKTRQAIKESVDSLRLNTWSWDSITRLLPLADSTITPILARRLCDRIVRCYGFPDIKSDDVAKILTAVVFRNLAKFIVYSISKGIWNLGAAASYLFFFTAPPLVRSWPGARMIVKCACDLIIILDSVFEFQGKDATCEHIAMAQIKYSSRKDADGKPEVSPRAKVHKEVEEHFSTDKRFYKNLNKTHAMENMRKIITRNGIHLSHDLSSENLATKAADLEDDSLLGEEIAEISEVVYMNPPMEAGRIADDIQLANSSKTTIDKQSPVDTTMSSSSDGYANKESGTEDTDEDWGDNDDSWATWAIDDGDGTM